MIFVHAPKLGQIFNQNKHGPRGWVVLSETKTRPIFSKKAKYCPNPIIIIIKVVEDVPRSVRDVSEHICDDLL